PPDGDDDVLAHHGGEALERGSYGIRTRGEVQEAVLAVRLGGEGLRCVNALRGDGNARQHAALLVADDAADGAALDLRERWHRRGDARGRERQRENDTLHSVIPPDGRRSGSDTRPPMSRGAERLFSTACATSNGVRTPGFALIFGIFQRVTGSSSRHGTRNWIAWIQFPGSMPGSRQPADGVLE